MPSLLNRFRGGKRRKGTLHLASSSEEGPSHDVSDVPSSSKPQQLEDDDDRTHPLQEQSPPSRTEAESFDRASNLRFMKNRRDARHRSTQSHKRQNFFSYRRSSGRNHKTTPGQPQAHASAPPDPIASTKTVVTSKRGHRSGGKTFQNGKQLKSENHLKSTVEKRKSSSSPDDTSHRNEPSSHTVEEKNKFSSASNSSSKNLRREAERIARAAAALDNKGNELFERGQFDRAMVTYTKALKLKRRTFHAMLEDADELMDEADNLEEALDENRIKSLSPKTDEKLLVSMATSINNIGYLRQRSGEATPDETMAAYKKSLQIKRKILGKDSLSVGKTLNNIGSVHYIKRDYDGAIAAYDEALQIMQANLGTSHPDVATVWSNRGDVYLGMSKKTEALTQYRQALKIRWEVFGGHNPKVVRLLEKIAAIEVGEIMSENDRASRGTGGWSDDGDLFDLDYRPVDREWHLLHGQVEDDLNYVDWLEKRMAVDMVKDKLVILRGMRELTNEGDDHDESDLKNEPPSNLGSVKDKKPARASVNREEALKSVKSRLARIRERRNSDYEQDGNSVSSISGIDKSTSSFGPSIYTDSRRVPNLSNLEADELKGGVDSVKSALVLKQGIASLRSLGESGED